MPAYIIAHDRTLEALAAHPPATPGQLLATPGFGPKKVETYGEDLLEILRDYAEAPAEQATANEPATQGWTADEDSRLVELFHKNASLSEVCAALDRPPADIWSRLAQLLSSNDPKV
jgi:hypothetical protein